MTESTKQRIDRLQTQRRDKARLVERKGAGVGTGPAPLPVRDRDKMIANVAAKMDGGKVTNLDRLLETIGEGEEIPDEERGICYGDLRDARARDGDYTHGQEEVGKLRPLNDAQLYSMWRRWVAREKRVVSTSTFAGWLGSTEP